MASEISEIRERLASIETGVADIQKRMDRLDYVPRGEILLMREETNQRLKALEEVRNGAFKHIAISWLGILAALAVTLWTKVMGH